MKFQQFQDPQAFDQLMMPHLLPSLGLNHVLAGLIRRLAERAAPSSGAPAPAIPKLFAVLAAGVPQAIAVERQRERLLLAALPHGDDRALAVLAEALAPQNPTAPLIPQGVSGPEATVKRFIHHWQRHTGDRATPRMVSNLYVLERLTPWSAAPGAMRPAVPADAPRLADWYRAFIHETLGEPLPDALSLTERGIQDGVFYVWELDGQPVAVAGGAAIDSLAIARFAPLYVPPSLRQLGYGRSLTAAVSERLLDGGRRRCYLAADRAIVASNRLYQSLGYRPCGVGLDLDLHRP